MDYLIDPTFRNTNRLFEIHSKMVMMILQDILLINITCYCRIKELNALIDSNPFFDLPIKKKQEAYEELIEMSRNNAIQQEIY